MIISITVAIATDSQSNLVGLLNEPNFYVIFYYFLLTIKLSINLDELK